MHPLCALCRYEEAVAAQGTLTTPLASFAVPADYYTLGHGAQQHAALQRALMELGEAGAAIATQWPAEVMPEGGVAVGSVAVGSAAPAAPAMAAAVAACIGLGVRNSIQVTPAALARLHTPAAQQQREAERAATLVAIEVSGFQARAMRGELYQGAAQILTGQAGAAAAADAGEAQHAPAKGPSRLCRSSTAAASPTSWQEPAPQQPRIFQQRQQPSTHQVPPQHQPHSPQRHADCPGLQRPHSKLQAFKDMLHQGAWVHVCGFGALVCLGLERAACRALHVRTGAHCLHAAPCLPAAGGLQLRGQVSEGEDEEDDDILIHTAMLHSPVQPAMHTNLQPSPALALARRALVLSTSPTHGPSVGGVGKRALAGASSACDLSARALAAQPATPEPACRAVHARWLSQHAPCPSTAAAGHCPANDLWLRCGTDQDRPCQGQGQHPMAAVGH